MKKIFEDSQAIEQMRKEQIKESMAQAAKRQEALA